jgi:hypothetical protein
LRKLQATLEVDPGSVGTDASRDLIRSTNDLGHRVEQGIASIGQELNLMASTLTPAKSKAQR